MTKTVGMTELGKHLQKSMPSIRNYITKGMPVVTEANRDKGIQWEFDLQDCIDWYDEYQMNRQLGAKKKDEFNEYEHEDIVAARKKKIEVETERLQLRLEQERGELVPIDEIVSIVERQFGSVKAHLLAIPDKVSPVLVNRSDQKEINDIVRGYVIEALEELHMEQLTLDDDTRQTEDGTD